MKLIAQLILAGAAVAGTYAEAAAFGRGTVHAEPPHYSGGEVHAGVAAGPYGGVHAGYVPSHATVPPGGGYYRAGGVSPAYGAHPGAVGGGVHGGGVVRPSTPIVTPGVHGGVVMGPGAGAGIAAGHYTRYLGPSALQSIGAGIRGYGYGYPYFTPAWQRARLGLWWPQVWWGGAGVWYVPPWDTLAPYLSIAAPPIPYNYGSTAVLLDGTMYLNGVAAGSAVDYAAQALAIANAGRAFAPPPTDEWQPLGVFGLIQGNDAMAQRIFQLAVDKAGIVRGNYYDAVADSNQPVFGAVDQKTQRIAWSIGDRKDIVYEAGLSNLLLKETTVLIHYGKERTQQMILVRLEQPPG